MTALVAQRRIEPARLASALVIVGLVLFVGIVYVVTVLGGGALIGRTSSPDTRLSILATLLVALGLGPAQTALQALARRAFGERNLPYDVLSRFSGAVAQSHDAEVPATMARVLGEGTCATWAQVWLLVGESPVLTATWPDRATGADYVPAEPGHEPPGQQTLAVRLAGETLGALRIQKPPHQPLTPVEQRLFEGLAAQAGPVLHGARLRAELAGRVDELSSRADELRASRGRVIEAQDTERRRLERDIHDGAQQHLVALAVNLRLAQTLAGSAPEAAAKVMTEQVEATDLAIQTLVDLSRGIYPVALGEQGIGPALGVATSAATIPVQVDDHTHGRFAPDVELAVYFCCLEAIQNALKHAEPSHVRVTLREERGQLVATVEDDGNGFDARSTSAGAGLSNMRDRLDAIGGRVVVDSTAGRGTRVVARVSGVSS